MMIACRLHRRLQRRLPCACGAAAGAGRVRGEAEPPGEVARVGERRRQAQQPHARARAVLPPLLALRFGCMARRRGVSALA